MAKIVTLEDDGTKGTIDSTTLGGGSNITSGTLAPSGGNDGDIYLQYT